MVQRVTSKLVKHEGQTLHTLLESILTRLTALELPLMTFEEEAKEDAEEEVSDTKFGVPAFLPAS